MRIAYILLWNVQSGDGIAQKVRTQADMWIKLGHEAKLFCNVLGELPSSKSGWLDSEECFRYDNWLQYLFDSNQEVLKRIEEYTPDIVYLRFETFQPYHRKLNQRFPVVMELNADDVQEYQVNAKQKFTSKLMYLYHRLTRKLLFGPVKGIVSVTHEIANLPNVKYYNKPYIVLPNTLNLENYEAIPYEEDREMPNLVFMGSNGVFWHGISKIIELAKNTVGELNFHLIGNIKNDESTSSPNITYHGYLSKREFEELFSKIDVGIGSLSFHEKNMYEACSLKTREYLSRGLPIILGYNDTAFLNRELPQWVLQLPNAPDNVELNIAQIIEFARQMKGRRLTKDEVAPYIDSLPFEKKRLAFFQSILSK